jgi:CrcB protein
MMIWFCVASGGAIGSVLRFAMMSIIGRSSGFSSFPYGTVCVNVCGSLLMGVLVGWLSKTLPHTTELRAFLAVGVLGGFTTFSAFSLDTVSLLEQGAPLQAVLYAVASVICSVLALFLGLVLLR